MKASVLITFLVVVLVARYCIGDKWIIKNESELINTCTRTCATLGGIANKFGCQEISSCRRSSYGWVRGFVRCDYCKCFCKESAPTHQKFEHVKSNLYVMEHDLFGTCVHAGCGDPKKVQRTNFKGCDIVQNCVKEYYGGYVSGFVYCDRCKCQCINRKTINKYHLENIKWDLNQRPSFSGSVDLGHATAENHSKHPQTMWKSIEYTETKGTTLTNSDTKTYGVTMEISAGIPTIADVKLAVSSTLSLTTEVGKTTTHSKTHSMKAIAIIQPMSRKTLTVVGSRYKANIPYTADLVTEYKDGTTSRKKTSGILRDAGVTNFVVRYSKDMPLPSSNSTTKRIV